VKASTGLPGGGIITGFLACPTGKKVTGGGWTTDDNNSDVVIFSNGPSVDGGAWTGGMRNNGAATTQLTLYALCSTVP
jgi:hypothetical protein